MSLSKKAALSIILLTLLPLCIIGVAFYLTNRRALEDRVYNQMDSLAQAQERQIRGIIDLNIQRLNTVALRAGLRGALSAYTETPSRENREELLRFVRGQRVRIGGFRVVSILDLKGNVLSSSMPRFIGENHSTAPYFLRGIEGAQGDHLQIGPRGGLTIVGSSPIPGEENTLGVLVAALPADVLLNLAQDYSGLGKSGEVCILKSDKEGGALCLTPLRFDPESALTRTFPPGSTFAKAVHEKREGILTGATDYRGAKVVASIRHIPGTDWSVAVKLDEEEAFAPASTLLQLLLFSLIAFSLLVGMVATAFARSIGRSAKALEKSELQFRSVTQSASVGIISADSRGVILSWNAGAESMFGYTPAQIIGKPLFALMPERYREAHLRAMERLNATGESRLAGKEVDVHGLHKDGHEFPIEISIGTWVTDAGRFFSGIIRDLSDRKESEKQRIVLEEQLRQAHKMEAVGRLAGGIAHDFNNVLTAITGYADLLTRNIPANSPYQSHLREIQKSSARAASLTQQLLAFSRRQILQPRVLSPNQIIAGMDDMLRRLIGDDVQLETRLESNTGQIRADKSQFEQVLLNLAINARDAMPQGGTLSITTAEAELGEKDLNAEDKAVPGRFVHIRVADTGSGMDPETLSHLFEPFFTTKGPEKGTGLGLSTVYGIITQSGGAVRVESEPGKGSAFHLYFPRVEAPQKDTDRRPADADARKGTGRVLLVEDSEPVKALLRDVLRDAGYEVLQAGNGSEAVQIFDEGEGHVDVLATDVVMPGMNGRVLADTLKARKPDLKILFMSGYTDDVVLQAGILPSDSAFLSKPFSPDEFLRKLREVIHPENAPEAAANEGEGASQNR